MCLATSAFYNTASPLVVLLSTQRHVLPCLCGGRKRRRFSFCLEHRLLSFSTRNSEENMGDTLADFTIKFTPLQGARRSLTVLQGADSSYKIEKEVDVNLYVSGLPEKSHYQSLLLYMCRKDSVESASLSGSRAPSSKGHGNQTPPPFLLRHISQSQWLNYYFDSNGRGQYKIPNPEKASHLHLIFHALCTSLHDNGWNLIIELLGSQQESLVRKAFPLCCVKLNRLRPQKRQCSPEKSMQFTEILRRLERIEEDLQFLKRSQEKASSLHQRCIAKCGSIEERDQTPRHEQTGACGLSTILKTE